MQESQVIARLDDESSVTHLMCRLAAEVPDRAGVTVGGETRDVAETRFSFRQLDAEARRIDHGGHFLDDPRQVRTFSVALEQPSPGLPRFAFMTSDTCVRCVDRTVRCEVPCQEGT